MFERFEWIQTPDGTYILIDTWTGKVVENSPTYRTTSTSSTSTSSTSTSSTEDIKK